MGKDAFKLYDTFIGYGPHLLKRKQRPLGARQIAQLKKEFRLAGRPWPYEAESPTRKVTPPPRPSKGHIYERKKAEREKEIAANMAKMPKWIAEAKAKKQLPKDISIADRLFMTKKQLYKKYVKSKP